MPLISLCGLSSKATSTTLGTIDLQPSTLIDRDPGYRILAIPSLEKKARSFSLSWHTQHQSDALAAAGMAGQRPTTTYGSALARRYRRALRLGVGRFGHNFYPEDELPESGNGQPVKSAVTSPNLHPASSDVLNRLEELETRVAALEYRLDSNPDA